MRFPNDSERIAIVGRNGSGKTVAAVWHLSQRGFDKMPWLIFNFKGDDLIDSIPGTKELSVTSNPPKSPGLYIVRPMPHQTEELDDMLWKVWKNEQTGIYFDEGYMVGNSKAFQALLTQGRSKLCPMIILTQRPVWINRFVWSESDFFQIFSLTNLQDRKTAAEFVPAVKERKLLPYHSIYHDAKAEQTVELSPVPERVTILTTFRDRRLVRRTLL